MVKRISNDYFAVTPREILNWVVISSEKNRRLQLSKYFEQIMEGCF